MKARWVLPLVLVVMIITASGAVVARALYAQPTDAAAAAVLPGKAAVPPGDPTVFATTDASAHPLYEASRHLLQTYFDAINRKDYQLWLTVVTAKRAKQSEQEWRIAYRSTNDGSIVMQRIESAPDDTAKVLLSFTSVQDPGDAPPELPERCIHWQLVFPLSIEGGEWKLDSGPAGQAPQHQKC